MSTHRQVKEIIRETDSKPKKSLGQNFLVCDWVYESIVNNAKSKGSDIILEVGPGPGILTEKLAQTGRKVIAIEKDHRLIEHLNGLTTKYPNLSIIEGDILTQDIKNIVGDKTYQIIGNIPYYITSHLIRLALESWPKPQSILFMVQKEVAQRIRAQPPDMSLLAVSVAVYANSKVIAKVGRTCFSPPPNVDSALIEITPHEATLSPRYTERFFQVAKSGFREARKQIINNLSSGLKTPKDHMLQVLESANIDPRRRAETLTIAEWHTLTKTFFSSTEVQS